MRVIKLGGISFIVLFALVTLISLLIPSHIRISKATNLPNKRESIFALLKNEAAWHPAYTDSTTAIEMGNLQKKLVEQTDSTFVIQLRQGSRNPVVSGWELYGGPSSDSLTLQWYMDFQLSWYPWQKFSSLFFEPTYGAMMQKGLADFKKQLTAQSVVLYK